MTCDPNWANVVLLLNMDGSNGSTSFPDLSGYGNNATAQNAAAVTTAQAKFGTGSLLTGYDVGSTNGFGNCLTVPYSPSIDLSQCGPYTIEGWFYYAAGTYSAALPLFGTNPRTGSAGNPGLGLEIEPSGGNVTVILTMGNNPYFFGTTGTIAAAAGVWHHFAFVSDGSSTIAVYIDGNAVSLGTSSTDGPLYPWSEGTAPVTSFDIGNDANVNIPAYYIDEVRVSAGIQRYTSNFTPPTQAFPTIQCFVVPNLVNTSIPVATALLENAGLVLGNVTYASSAIILDGNIISQDVAAGSGVVPGEAVDVVVSTGLPALTVPDLFGLTQADATTLLLSLGLAVGAVSSAPSKFVPAGEVQTQNPSAGAAVASGTIVSFVLSLGVPATSQLFDFEATVISQYANSPTILQLCQNLNQYIDQSANFANFYNYVWNVDTAVGFGLDIWGTIVNVSRLLNIPTGVDYVGFYEHTESQPDQDWTPAGSSQPPYNDPPVGGAFYTGYNATTAYLLPDDAYRQLILAKAFANICTTTAPAINQILQNLYGPGTAFVLNTGPMAISYNLTFKPTAVQLAILEQSGVIPTPPGVSVVINTSV